MYRADLERKVEISSMEDEARITEGNLKYLKYLQGEGNTDLLRRMTEERLNNNKDYWTIDIRNTTAAIFLGSLKELYSLKTIFKTRLPLFLLVLYNPVLS